tara:strand:+ start:5778 stop:7013 length:1236 start_codon:yes stop_codon:yes gene_type:complete
MQTIQNTQANIKNTITMSLSQLNSQIMKANSKLFVEFARNFGEDLLGDLMNVMRQLHNENQNKTERPSVEESFELMQEHFQETLDARMEQMSNEVPRSVRGRKPKAKTIVAVDDTDDEGEKRGRPKKEEAKLEQTSLDSEQQQVLANAKKATAKPKKATTAPKKKSKGKGPKMFRRIERTVVKKNGKEKREKVWRKPDYELKEGEVFLNTWAVSEKTPNAKTPTFDNEADAFKALNGEQVAQPTMTTIIDIPAQPKKTSSASSKKKVVEEVVVEVVQKPVEELKADTYEDEGEGVETDGDEGIDGIENNDDETTVEVKTTTEEDDKIDIQKTFNPTEPYAPFTGVDEMVGKLIRFTDKTSVNYGKIINKETLQVFGWVDPNDEEQYVEEQPDYVEEEENDDEDVLDCDWDF